MLQVRAVAPCQRTGHHARDRVVRATLRVERGEGHVEVRDEPHVAVAGDQLLHQRRPAAPRADDEEEPSVAHGRLPLGDPGRRPRSQAFVCAGTRPRTAPATDVGPIPAHARGEAIDRAGTSATQSRSSASCREPALVVLPARAEPDGGVADRPRVFDRGQQGHHRRRVPRETVVEATQPVVRPPAPADEQMRGDRLPSQVDRPQPEAARGQQLLGQIARGTRPWPGAAGPSHPASPTGSRAAARRHRGRARPPPGRWTSGRRRPRPAAAVDAGGASAGSSSSWRPSTRRTSRSSAIVGSGRRASRWTNGRDPGQPRRSASVHGESAGTPSRWTACSRGRMAASSPASDAATSRSRPGSASGPSGVPP